MKYCKDCKHLTYDSPFRLCAKSLIKNEYDDPVMGITVVKDYEYCHTERKKENGCGPDAKNFEPSMLYKIKLFFRGKE
jgi:hypothetical protein